MGRGKAVFQKCPLIEPNLSPSRKTRREGYQPGHFSVVLLEGGVAIFGALKSISLESNFRNLSEPRLLSSNTF